MKFLSLFKDIKKIANYQWKSLMSAELNGCFDIKNYVPVLAAGQEWDLMG